MYYFEANFENNLSEQQNSWIVFDGSVLQRFTKKIDPLFLVGLIGLFLTTAQS